MRKFLWVLGQKIALSRRLAYEGYATTLWPLIWGNGRRTKENGYKLAVLFYMSFLERFTLQVMLAHYPKGASQQPHVDTWHENIYRMVVVLKKSGKGGELKGKHVKRFGRFYFLRPELHKHRVTKVRSGERLSLLVSLFVKPSNDPIITVEKIRQEQEAKETAAQ